MTTRPLNLHLADLRPGYPLYLRKILVGFLSLSIKCHVNTLNRRWLPCPLNINYDYFSPLTLCAMWANWIQLILSHLNWGPILILSSNLRIYFCSGPFFSVVTTKYFHILITSPTRPVRPTSLIFHDLVILVIFCEEYKLWSSSLWDFVQPPGSTYCLERPAPNTLSLCHFHRAETNIQVLKQEARILKL